MIPEAAKKDRNSPEFIQYLRENVIVKDGALYVKARTGPVIKGRKYFRIGKTTAPVSKFAWAIHHGQYPDRHVRYKDGDETNNSIENLVIGNNKSIADKPLGEKTKERLRAKIAKGEFPGVAKHRGKYAAFWRVETKRQKWIGSFDTPEEAAAAVKAFCEVHCPVRNPYNL